ncbi:MAG: DUF2798 domain-containing protein [Marinobacter adhaerens]|uniref:DUF2798 domain-containing protein n=1 Tax=Marinobacter adhaerens TaxID=1033846 RepID=A0A844I157_9GAMM|nr:DUF2798 domain-containing protein [Marinobacter adhaerens]
MSKETVTFLLFSTIMSLIMSGGMSLAMGLMTVEPTEAFATWPLAWSASFFVALPLSLVVVPVTRRGGNFIVQR